MMQLDPSTAYHRIYSNLLDKLDFYTDADVHPPDWVPVLIYDGNSPDMTLRSQDTVTPKSLNCSRSTGGSGNIGKCDDGKSPLLSHPCNSDLSYTTGTSPNFRCFSSANVLTKTIVDSGMERTRRFFIEHEDEREAALIQASTLGLFQSHDLGMPVE